MVLTFFGEGNIILLKMDKFQQWIVGRDVEWAKHVDIFVFSIFN